MRLTESRNARSEQLLVVPTKALTNREWAMAARRALEWISCALITSLITYIVAMRPYFS